MNAETVRSTVYETANPYPASFALLSLCDVDVLASRVCKRAWLPITVPAEQIDRIFCRDQFDPRSRRRGACPQNGQVIFERGYGVADLRSLHKIDAHTNFRLASCTKQFTAMAIMLLVHDGKLHYEDRLTDVFPDFPEYGKIHHHSQSSESHFGLAGL